MRRILFVAVVVVFVFAFQLSSLADINSEIKSYLTGCEIYSGEEEPVYLGIIDSEYKPDSIFNEYGLYGNPYSAKSIWNDYATYGSKYSIYSARNKNASRPPFIVKDDEVVAILTTNKSIKYGISPNYLKELFDE